MQQTFKAVDFLSSIPEWLWKSSLPVLGVVVIGTDYFLGQSYYSTWLRAFSADPEVFPPGREMTLLYGALAFTRAGVGLAAWSGMHKLLIVGTFLYFAFGFVLWSVADHYRPRIQKWEEGRNREVRHTSLARFCFRVFVVLCCMMLFFLGVPLLGAIVALPGAIGETVGALAAHEAVSEYARGCETATESCISLRKDGGEVARGFRIAQSNDRIALYLDGVTREFAVAGYSLESVPKAGAASASTASAPR